MNNYKFLDLKEINGKKFNQDMVEKITNQYDEKSYLPLDFFHETIDGKINSLLEQGIGCFMIENDQLTGWMIGYPVDEFWGEYPGVYVPAFGHFSKNKRNHKAYERLYTFAAKVWLEHNCVHQAISYYLPNDFFKETFYQLGFGLRCVDGIASLPIAVDSKTIKDYSVYKMELSNIDEIIHLQKGLEKHFLKSPIMMFTEKEDSKQYLESWMNKENRHLWCIKINDKAIGFMKIEDHGETLISGSKTMMNITGAFIDPKYRSQGLAEALLNEISKWLTDHGYEYLGVDYESFNVPGAHFWRRYFKDYRHSVARHIDERLIVNES